MHYHHSFILRNEEEERALQLLLKRFNIKESTRSAELRSLIMKLYSYVKDRDDLRI